MNTVSTWIRIRLRIYYHLSAGSVDDLCETDARLGGMFRAVLHIFNGTAGGKNGAESGAAAQRKTQSHYCIRIRRYFCKNYGLPIGTCTEQKFAICCVAKTAWCRPATTKPRCVMVRNGKRHERGQNGTESSTVCPSLAKPTEQYVPKCLCKFAHVLFTPSPQLSTTHCRREIPKKYSTKF